MQQEDSLTICTENPLKGKIPEIQGKQHMNLSVMNSKEHNIQPRDCLCLRGAPCNKEQKKRISKAQQL